MIKVIQSASGDTVTLSDMEWGRVIGVLNHVKTVDAHSADGDRRRVSELAAELVEKLYLAP